MIGKKVAVALSGGVDSAVAAYLLREAGYDVTGIHMRRFVPDLSNVDEKEKTLCNDEAILLEQICPALGITCSIVDLVNEFKCTVIDYFQGEYGRGRTPNPCIQCNRMLKFGILFDRAIEIGADYFATGHYAGISYFDDRYHLLKGKDRRKDQSYVLYMLDQKKLGRLLFPLGQYTRNEVMTIAGRIGVPVGRESGSQDLCFVDGDYTGYIRRHYFQEYGEIIDRSGNIIGRHNGIAGYTIGQRRKLRIASEKPLYVTDINPDSNTITVGEETDLYKKELIVIGVNWISGFEPDAPFEGKVKIRYKTGETPAVISPGHGPVKIYFKDAQRAITPGQAAVFYIDDEVLGGGTIDYVA